MDTATLVFLIVFGIVILGIIALLVYANTINVNPTPLVQRLLIRSLDSQLYLVPRGSQSVTLPALYINGMAGPYPEPTLYWQIIPQTTGGITIKNIFLGSLVQVVSDPIAGSNLFVGGSVIGPSTIFTLEPVTEQGSKGYAIRSSSGLYFNTSAKNGFVGLSRVKSTFLLEF